MQRKYTRFKKLKLQKREKKKNRRRKKNKEKKENNSPELQKANVERQRFITTIKNVTEKKKENKSSKA